MLDIILRNLNIVKIVFENMINVWIKSEKLIPCHRLNILVKLIIKLRMVNFGEY